MFTSNAKIKTKSWKGRKVSSISKNWRLMNLFMVYCIEHPDERFWQALRNFSGADFITYTKGTWEVDTFYWDDKDEFNKSVDEE
jgi:hypothetical protein